MVLESGSLSGLSHGQTLVGSECDAECSPVCCEEEQVDVILDEGETLRCGSDRVKKRPISPSFGGPGVQQPSLLPFLPTAFPPHREMIRGLWGLSVTRDVREPRRHTTYCSMH